MNPLFLQLAVSLSIGLLVGLERGWRTRNDPAGSRTSGIRTYGIAGLLGGIFAALAVALQSPAVFAAGFIGFAAIFAWFQMREAVHDKSFSVTGAITGLCVFALGGLAVLGDYKIAAAGGVALAAVLASRELLHDLLKKLSWEELRAALTLMVMTVILLPLLPNRAIDPWGGFNPWEVWLFTVLTAAISYAGYIATRVLGAARGWLVSGLAGGLVSSTAVTVAFAYTARAGKSHAALAGAAACAAMVSVLRVAGIVFLLRPEVLKIAGLPALAAAAVFGGYGFFLLARGGRAPEDIKLPQSPFRLVPLLAFAAGFAAISMTSAALVPHFGAGSVLVTSGLSGMFDVDVAVLSALRLPDPPVTLEIVGQAVLAGLFANAAGRLSLAVVAGPRGYWLHLATATALAAAAGAAGYALAQA